MHGFISKYDYLSAVKVAMKVEAIFKVECKVRRVRPRWGTPYYKVVF